MFHVAINFEDDFAALWFLDSILKREESEVQDVWKDDETDDICFGIYMKELDDDSC